MRFNSIRFKLTCVLIVIVGFVIYFTWFLNQAFAENYYIASEKTNIVQTYKEVKTFLSEGSSQAKITEEMEQLSNSTNIKMMIVQASDSNYSQFVVFTNLIDGGDTYEEILQYLLQVRKQLVLNQNEEFFDSDSDEWGGLPWFWSSKNNDLDTLINQGYIVEQLVDRSSGQKAIYLFGVTDDDNFMVAMRVSLEGIQASVNVSSRFLAYIGWIGIVLGSIIIMIVSNHYTRPIKEMANVADRMTHLDFEAKVTVNTGDEMEELGNSMNQLSEKLEQTIADLKSANLELQKDIENKEQIDEMRKEFLSHVSHELKTPIALIQGYAEGLKENISDDEESKDFYCEVIVDEAKKMNTMVRKLLTLNQIEFGNDQLNMQRFNASQMIRNKLAASQILFQNKNTTVIFDENEEYFVWADEFMIEEVFSNYLSNALNHVTQDGTIRVWYEQREKDLRIHVYNDGETIPEKDLEKLWIRFYKVDKARTREYGGSGIGLSIVAATMDAHGKKYGVTNKEHGVDFYFDLDCSN
ncbi:MAG: HAMP domain-containing histidine kinase [Clostridiales bacterium]|nr:HAMP domain-containing histidine kinase [Clostridiales bacterium]